MRDQDKTRDQLAAELAQERRRVSELEAVLGRTKLAQEKLLKTHDELHEELAEETTARIRFQEALASSERFHRTLVETSKDIIWTVGLDLKYTYVSPSVYEVLGFTVDEIMSTDPLDGLTPSSRERSLQMFREELDFETKLPMDRFRSRTVEIERYRKDGSVAWEEVTATLLRNSTGRPIGILGISRDIADRKRAEESLQRSHKELEQRVKDRTADLLKANEELKKEIKERLRAEEALRRAHDELEARVDERTAELLTANKKLSEEISERIRLEQRLAEREQFYRTIVETSRDMIWSTDMNLRYTYVSPSVTAVLGYTPEELVSREDPLGTVAPASRERIFAALKEELSRKIPHGSREFMSRTLEVERYRKDGSPVWTEFTSSFLRDARGRPIGIVGVTRDITERKGAEEALRRAHDELEQRVRERTAELVQANEDLKKEVAERKRMEEALKESEARYRQLFEEAPISLSEQDRSGMKSYLTALRASGVEDFRKYFETHPEEAVKCVAMTKILALNRAALEFLGAQSFQDLEENYHRVIHPKAFRDNVDIAVAIAEGIPSGRREIAMRTLAGEEKHVILTWCILKGYEETLSRVWVSAVDITDLKRAEEALRQSEERFRIVFEAAQDCIYIKDRDLRYTHVNPAMLDLLDLPLTEITGRTDSDLFGTDLGARFASLEARVLAGQTIETEQSLTIGGADLAFSVVRFPVRDASGTIIGLCGIARDVTERKSWESELSIEADQFSSLAMKEILRQIRLVAKSDSIILLLGESGSGKDFLARYVHEHSNRSGGPFFAINCAALAPELVEAELFGHEAGAFTGSRGRKRGLLELAEGGTLLLNEIGELPARLQAKLLTFLDTQSFIRVGGEKSVSVNTRIIAATNRDLQKEMESGNFRADLFYRLNVLAITVPPLRHRIQDLPVLVREIVAGLATRLGLHGTPFIEPEAMNALSGYSWPGNIRELRNVLERSLILGGHARIEASDLKILSESAAGPAGSHLAFAVEVGPGVSMPEAIQQAKRMLVQEGLRRSGGSLKHAAYLLGISRDSLKHHLKSLGGRGRKSPTL